MKEGEIFKQKEDTKKEEQILADLLTYENPREIEYRSLTAREALTPRQDFVDFATHWNTFRYPEHREIISEKAVVYMKKKLKGKTLVDLCGGSDMKKPYVIPEIASMSGCKIYINVDILAPNFDKIKTANKIDAFSVQSDALNFVSRMKEGDVAFCINGVDEDIIPDEGYQKALAAEISRVVPRGGIVFGFNCTLPLEEFGFKLVSDDLEVKKLMFESHNIYEKI